MSDRTVRVSERDLWVIGAVAGASHPATFVDVRKLNRIYDAFDLEGIAKKLSDEKKPIGELGTEEKDVRCEEEAFNYLLANIEPTLAKLVDGPALRVMSKALLELHEKLSKA